MQQRMSSAVSATCYCTGSAEMGRTACAQMYHTLSQINHQWTLHVQTCSVWRGKWSQHQLSQLTHTHTYTTVLLLFCNRDHPGEQVPER